MGLTILYYIVKYIMAEQFMECETKYVEHLLTGSNCLHWFFSFSIYTIMATSAFKQHLMFNDKGL